MRIVPGCVPNAQLIGDVEGGSALISCATMAVIVDGCHCRGS